MQPAPFGLLQSFLQNFKTDALDLHVHLGGCQPIGCTRCFKIHVSHVIFLAPNVRKHHALPSPTIIPIAIPATGLGIGTPASISAMEPPQTLAMEEDPLDSVISERTRIT